MKPVQLLTAALLIILTAAFTSCKPSRVWATKEKDDSDKDRKEYSERRDDDDNNRYDDRSNKRNNDRYEGRYETTPPPLPRSYRYTQLVISPTPGFVMNRYPDGRFYHRSPEGFIYWKAPDNRFFLDRAHINRVNYHRDDYDRWRSYYRGGSNRRY